MTETADPQADVRFERVTKRYGGAAAVSALTPRDPARDVLLAARSVRMRQDHDLAARSPASSSPTRARSSSATSASRRCRRTGATSAMVFQNYALFPHLDVSPKTSPSACTCAGAAGRAGRAGARRARARAARRLRRPLSDAALGRAAAARRARPGARHAAGGAAARRAARRARQEAARGDAGRAPRAAAAARHHDRLRDPRPGGGADHVGPHRGDARTAASSRSARRARSTSARRPRSSRPSSAPAT